MENFQVFAESIVAVKSEVEDGGVDCQESDIDCYDKITLSHVKMEFEEHDIHSKYQEFPSEVAEDNTGTATEMKRYESIVKKESPTQLMEKANTRVSGRVLRPGRRRSYHLSQSDSDNSQTDQSSYQVSPDEMSNSDVAEAIECNLHCETGKKVQGGEYLSGYSNESSAVVGGLSDGLRTAECSSDTPLVELVEVDLLKERNDPLQSGNQNEIGVVEKEKSVLCEQCGKKLKNQKSLRQHILGMHSSREIYKCKICNKAFKTTHRLYLHSLFHKETPKFRCSECGRGFQLKQYFTDHLRMHGLKLFQCVHCGVDFRREGELEKHYPVHDGKVDWECDSCGGKYPTWGDLVTHRTVHQVKTVFICDTCGVEYAKKGDLIRHTYKHTRPHPCPTCGKTFPTKSELRTHSYSHSEVKPHECHVCKKRFNQPVHLSEHLKTHSEERPYPCKLCSYRGKTKSLLKSHQLKHSTSKPYKCSLCDRTFVSNGFKRRHERMSHKDKMAK